MVLTAAATLVAKFWNAGEDVFLSSGVKVCVILNSNTIFGLTGGAGVAAAHETQRVETVSYSLIERL